MNQANRPTTQLYDLDFLALQSLLESWGEPAYRARQMWEWLYVHRVDSFERMTNLPKSLRERLVREMPIGVPEVVDTVRSKDDETRKDLLQLADGETVEAVLMRYERRRTACISTQVGCAVGCPFCATGQMGLRRNLTSGEIVAQVLHFARILHVEGERLSNVVFMGMGEPLLNYDASLSAIHRITDPQGLNIGQRHITLSTAGVVPGIKELANEVGHHDGPLQITLAISLHAATDPLRDQLVPMNRRYNLDALFEACHHYIRHTGRRVSFEWALIEGANDTPRQARALAARMVGMLAHVNLIPLNPTAGYDGEPTLNETLHAFTKALDRRHVPHSVRLRRGIDIQAGCGQLCQRNQT
jgi:23S rRNA (adenine2503-C2)-methyltransferase